MNCCENEATISAWSAWHFPDSQHTSSVYHIPENIIFTKQVTTFKTSHLKPKIGKQGLSENYGTSNVYDGDNMAL